jgi:microcystin-dependent protein
MSYIGTTDPSGWVICDGLTRDVSDNRFEYLAPLLNTAYGITSNTSNSITPPNLISRFIYGGSTPCQTGGKSSVTLTSSNLPTHTHSTTDYGHSHALSFDGATGIYNYNNANVPLTGTTNMASLFTNNGNQSAYYPSTNLASTGLIINPTGDNQSFSILPPYTTMNYIIKY